MIEVPGVQARTVQRCARVRIAAAAGQLDHGELGGQHRAGLAQSSDDGRIIVQHLIFVRRRAPARWDAFGREQVLGAIRDAGQRRRGCALRERAVGFARLGERQLRRQLRERVIGRPEGLQAIQGKAGELQGRDFLFAQQLGRLKFLLAYLFRLFHLRLYRLQFFVRQPQVQRFLFQQEFLLLFYRLRLLPDRQGVWLVYQIRFL